MTLLRGHRGRGEQGGVELADGGKGVADKAVFQFIVGCSQPFSRIGRHDLRRIDIQRRHLLDEGFIFALRRRRGRRRAIPLRMPGEVNIAGTADISGNGLNGQGERFRFAQQAQQVVPRVISRCQYRFAF